MVRICLVPSTSLIIYMPSIISKSMVYVFCYTFRQYWHLLYLKEVIIIVRNNICQIESDMHKNVFSYSKIGFSAV